MIEMKETRSLNEEYYALSKSSNYADKLKAAAIQKEAEKDMEIAEIFRKLSAQLEFAVPDDAAVDETREELAKLIEARSRNQFMSYHNLMFDEEVLALSGGEVTRAEGVDYDVTEWVKGGLFDPAIFGGYGGIPIYDPETGKFSPEKPFTNRFGHIDLPCYIVTENAVSDVASLTGKDSNDISKVIHCASYLKFNEDGSSEIVTDKEADKLWGQAELLTGGNAIHELLVRLNLPDHPERMAFKVLPVLPTAYRPLGIIEGCWKYGISDLDLNDAYRFVLQRVSRINRLSPLNPPEVIMRNECRMLFEKIDALFNAIKDVIQSEKNNKNPSVLTNMYVATRHRIIGFDRAPLIGDGQILPWANFSGTIPVQMPDGSTEEMPMRGVLQRLGVASFVEFDSDEDDDEEEGKSRPSTDLLDAIQLAANEGKPLPRVRIDGDGYYSAAE